MSTAHGNLSIDSENIFPIIKKWLYSDHDIFLRELISNASDAITKIKKLDIMGEYSLPDDYEAKIEVVLDPKEKTLTVTDNGLGMTADEVEEYINRIAFSGATDFLEKYKDKSTDDQIIGHFGLGFYSAFMVADEVRIDTLSWQQDAVAVHWSCDGGTEYAMENGERDTVGTSITLLLNEDCLEFSNEYRVREVLEKYCSFMPVPIFLSNANAEPQYETIPVEEKTDKDTVIETIVEEAKSETKKGEDGKEEVVEVSPRREKVKILKRPVAINDIHPLWAKHPNECGEDDYREFYRNVFHDFKEPLFWIHLNMDYPFNLKGILYFPKINTEYESIEGTIKLYNNQVFIADNIKEVIPDFLLLLKGAIDCPDLPLNVSRSALQNDGTVKKINEYITKKVADKLSGMCKTEKDAYESYWDDIAPFIKFGCLRDEKFCDRINDYILFKDLDDKYLTLPELLKEDNAKTLDDKSDSNAEDKEETKVSDEDAADSASDADASGEAGIEDDGDKKDTRSVIYYVTDPRQQSEYVRLFKANGKAAVILDHSIDTSFITQLERRNENYKFMRIDADVTDALREGNAGDDDENADENKEALKSLTEIFRKALSNDKLSVKTEVLKDASVSSILTVSEEGRRMQEMMKMYNMYGSDPSAFGGDETLILNLKNKLVTFILDHPDDTHVPVFCRQLYDLAKIANQPLEAEAMTEFIRRSNEIMLVLSSKQH